MEQNGNRERNRKVSNDDLCCSKVASFYSKNDGLEVGGKSKTPGEMVGERRALSRVCGEGDYFFRKIFPVEQF